MTANKVAPLTAGGEAGPAGPAAEDAMKGVEATPEEQERLATGNNNGSLDCKLPVPQPPGPRSAFHSTRVFMLVFLSGWVLQGMFLTYFVSVTTTIEKLYRVESKTTGTLLAATEIGQICTALFLTYLAGRGHRPRWIACMMLVLAVGVIGCVLPHILYGTRLLDVHLDTHRGEAAPVCSDQNRNLTVCNSSQVHSSEERSSMTAIVIPWLFFCLLVVGVGQTGIATLGIPYVDDNVGSRQSPLYMAITIGIRVIGPALGFLLGALCTRVYVDPLFDPGYDQTDQRWVGAWWLGMVFIAGFIVLLSILMFFFPRQIKQEPVPLPPKKNKEKSEPLFKDFLATIKRQLTNDILMWRTASSVLHLMPISGVYSFLPKYLEKQFRLPTHDANLVSGLGGILVMGLGIITAGVVILKLVPTARQVAAWTACTAAIYSAGMILLMFVKCPEENYKLLNTELSLSASLGAGLDSSPACSADCHCIGAPYAPVCGQDEYTYLSPCQAGCHNSMQLGNSTWLYYDCSCINSSTTGAKAIDTIKRYALHNSSELAAPASSGLHGFAVSGECGGSCKQIYIFIAIFAAIMFVHASGEVGAVLLIIRCTDKHDKAMAMGVIQFAIGVFGNVPCPIVFGAAIDAACRLRDAACGLLGACASYDSDNLRHFFLGEWYSSNVPCPIVFGAAIDAACRLRDAACGLLGACASYDSDNLRHFLLGECYSSDVPCPIVFGAAIDAACRLRDAACGMLGACASYDSDNLRHFLLGECYSSDVPCPIVFGAAIDAACRLRDAACRLRDAACGLLGACASYDSDNLRHFFLGLSAALMFLAFIMDMLVWSKAGRIDMNPGEPAAPDSAPLQGKRSDTQL